MRIALVLVLTAGCRSIFGITDPALASDANLLVTDVAVDSNDSGCTTFSTLLDTCALTFGGSFPPTATLYDSTTGLVSVGGADQPIGHTTVTTTTGVVVDVIPVSQFPQDADATVRLVGPVPIVIVAPGEIEIAGHLDVSAGGAGAGCDVVGTGHDGQAEGTTGDGGGGGGGGVNGANGGGSGGGHVRATGGFAVGGFVGGCSGGDGGLIAGIAGGSGGGAVYLISAQPILISGLVDASGAGGKGAPQNLSDHGGGGGGGGGGSLVFEAPGVTIAGIVNATGGGGGGGAAALTAGNAGKLGSAGGQGGSGGGGNGGNGTTAAVRGVDGADAIGGGGGGGATGRIHAITTSVTNTGTIAPPPS